MILVFGLPMHYAADIHKVLQTSANKAPAKKPTNQIKPGQSGSQASEVGRFLPIQDNLWAVDVDPSRCNFFTLALTVVTLIDVMHINFFPVLVELMF